MKVTSGTERRKDGSLILKARICEYTLEIYVFGKYETNVCCVCVTVTSNELYLFPMIIL